MPASISFCESQSFRSRPAARRTAFSSDVSRPSDSRRRTAAARKRAWSEWSSACSRRRATSRSTSASSASTLNRAPGRSSPCSSACCLGKLPTSISSSNTGPRRVPATKQVEMCTSVAPVRLLSSAAWRAPWVLTEMASSSDGLKVTRPAQFTTQASLPVRLRTCSSERPRRGSATSPAIGEHFSRRNRSRSAPCLSCSGRKGGADVTLPKNRSSALPPARGRISTCTRPISGYRSSSITRATLPRNPVTPVSRISRPRKASDRSIGSGISGAACISSGVAGPRCGTRSVTALPWPPRPACATRLPAGAPPPRRAGGSLPPRRRPPRSSPTGDGA